MIPGQDPATDPKLTGTSPAAARYNATLAAKASPIPRLGNYVKASSSSREGYTYVLPGALSPLKPITSIPHPPHPAVHHRRSMNAATDSPLPVTPDEEVPDWNVGARGNSAERRAMARERREVVVRALQGRTSDDSLSNDEEEEISGHDRASTDAEGAPESIEAFESVPLAHTKDRDGTRRSDDFDDDDDDGIAWAHLDADEMEARASQALAETPRPAHHDIAREMPLAPPYVAQMETPPGGATFIDRLKAVTTREDAPGSTTKKRKRAHLEHERPSAPGHFTSEPSMMDGTSTPSWVSARGTLTPPETERRRDLGAFSSALDLQGTASAPVTAVLSGNGSTSVHPLLDALNKDLIRRDRKAAADEKSREMLRGRVKALEGRVRELEAELRRVKSGR